MRAPRKPGLPLLTDTPEIAPGPLDPTLMRVGITEGKA